MYHPLNRRRPTQGALRVSMLVVAAILLAACQQTRSSQEYADLVVKNAKVYTVDASVPWAQAVAIREGKILGVGEDEIMAQWIDAHTRVVDLGGKLVLPAFGDGHTHPIWGGLNLAQCSLRGGKSVEEYLQTIATCITENPDADVIYGAGWFDGLFPPDGVPRKEVLDAIAPDRALVFSSTGGHSLWVNSRALELAGITKDTPDPLNGRIDRDPVTGEPVGGLQEAAKNLMLAHVPPPSVQTMKKALIRTADHFNSLGITSWLDAGIGILAGAGLFPVTSIEELQAYKAAHDSGELTVQVALTILWNNERGLEQIPGLLEIVEQARQFGFKVDCIKFLLDGVIAQHTAALLEPYSDIPEESGALQISADVFIEAVKEFDARGFQIHVHAIGDKAVRTALDAIAAARAQNGDRDNRHVITHLNMVSPEDQPRFGELHVQANFQPLWTAWGSYMDLTEACIGPERMAYPHYPVKSLRNTGAKIFYGSDWPVASANPLEGIETALTRRPCGVLTGRVLFAEEAVTLEEAIEAYTLNVAYMNHQEKERGSITPGKIADLVVLDQDIFITPAHEISKTKVLLTLFRGDVVYGDMPGF